MQHTDVSTKNNREGPVEIVKDCAERLALADRYLRRDSPYGIITRTKLRKCIAIYIEARRVLESST